MIRVTVRYIKRSQVTEIEWERIQSEIHRIFLRRDQIVHHATIPLTLTSTCMAYCNKLHTVTIDSIFVNYYIKTQLSHFFSISFSNEHVKIRITKSRKQLPSHKHTKSEPTKSTLPLCDSDTYKDSDTTSKDQLRWHKLITIDRVF